MHFPWGAETVLPVVALIINDNPEGHLLCMTYDSADAMFPCRMCNVPKDLLRHPGSYMQDQNLRNMEETIEFVAKHRENIEQRNQIGLSENALREKSLHRTASGNFLYAYSYELIADSKMI